MSDNPPPARPAPASTPGTPVSPTPDDSPVLPLQSRDETDAAWGERPELDDDERLLQDRPPHWDSR